MIRRFCGIALITIYMLALQGPVGLVAQESGQDKTTPKKPSSAKSASVDGTKKPLENTAAKPVDEKSKPQTGEKAAKKRLSSEHFLPASTKAWFSIPNPETLEAAFEQTQIGTLAQAESIKPFIESVEEQIKQWVDNQNVRLGIEIDDLHGVHSGEVCIAGVFPEVSGQQKVTGIHGMILLVDVSETRDKALALQKKINKEQVKMGAVGQNITVNGIQAKRFTLTNPKRFLKSRTSLQAIVNGWFLVCDNETIFREVLRRIAAPKEIKTRETLAAQLAFDKVMSQTEVEENETHIRWFVDPFGYAQLAQALKDEERVSRPRGDSWVEILKSQGFSAWRAVGGRVSVATDEHEFLHRTYSFVPSKPAVQNFNRMMNLFDFSGGPLDPAPWVPADCAAHLTFNWQMSKALESIGHIVNARMNSEDEWERILHDLKTDIDTPLDVKRLVGLINNRMTVVSTSERPITENSERVVFGVPVSGKPEFIMNSLEKALRAERINLGGDFVLKIDSASEMEFEEPEGPFEIPEDDFEDEAEDDRFELLATKFIAVKNSHLIVTNDKDYMKKLLARKESKLAMQEDYIRVKEAISKLTDDGKVCWRHFGRLDRVLEPNYEMLRRGDMGKSQTVLGRIINQVVSKRDSEDLDQEVDPDKVRKQKLDGKKLPKNYNKAVAPFLGPMGWVMEKESDGWRITGLVLAKNGETDVVKKDDVSDVSEKQR